MKARRISPAAPDGILLRPAGIPTKPGLRGGPDLACFRKWRSVGLQTKVEPHVASSILQLGHRHHLIQ